MANDLGIKGVKLKETTNCSESDLSGVVILPEKLTREIELFLLHINETCGSDEKYMSKSMTNASGLLYARINAYKNKKAT